MTLLERLRQRFIAARRTPDWSDASAFDPAWKPRTKRMAAMLRDARSILDIGCGSCWLKEFLRPDVLYHPLDQVRRGPDTIVCDLNKKQFPRLAVDACFVSGCLEYIRDVPWLIGRLADTGPVAVISYCCVEEIPDRHARRALGWVNDLSRDWLVQEFTRHGFILDEEAITLKNRLFRFISNDRRHS